MIKFDKVVFLWKILTRVFGLDRAPNHNRPRSILIDRLWSIVVYS